MHAVKQRSSSTVAGGWQCPFSDCGRLIDGDEIKRQAQAGGMGEQFYAVVFKRRVLKKTKTGKIRENWERGYRVPPSEDDVLALVVQCLAEKLSDWEAFDIVPSEQLRDGKQLRDGNKTTESTRYGMTAWRDMFSPRQLLGHGTSVEIFRELLNEERAKDTLTAATKAASVYLALALDKLRDYNSRMTLGTLTAS